MKKMDRDHKTSLIFFIVLILAICVPSIVKGIAKSNERKADIAQQKINNVYDGAKMLGATNCFEYQEGLISADDLDYDSSQVALNVHVFNKVSGDDVSFALLRRILYNGTTNDDGYVPLKSVLCGGLTKDEQQKIYNDYEEYTYDDNSDLYNKKDTYLEKLDAYYQRGDVQAVLKEKYGSEYITSPVGDITTLPVQALQEVINKYEGAPSL